MRATRLSPSRVAAVVALAAVAALFSHRATAAPSCLETSNACESDKLCTFKASLAEKKFIYETLLRNSQVTKKARGQKRDGVRYDGELYDASLKEAKERFPKDSAAEQKVKAGQIFQTKLREYVTKNFKLPTCDKGKLDRSLLPKAGYTGMETDEHCRIWVKFEGGQYEVDGFGSNDKTSCQEFYDRDRAHEVIHQRSCQAAKRRNTHLHSIDDAIEDEVRAYRHSVRLTKAYVRLLSLRCSSMPNPNEQKKRAKRIQDLLGPYLKKGG
jgi:hypothetical protein